MYIYIIGSCSTAYTAEETPYPSHFNVHLALEQLRATCRPPPAFLPEDDPIRQQPMHLQEDETPGPRVMVVGEAGAGKSTLCKCLINWAIRAGRARRDGDWTDVGSGRKVLFVNLDPADGAFTIPGTFSAAPIDTTLPTTTPVHPFGSTHSTSLPPLHQPNLGAAKWEPSPSLVALTPMFSGLSLFYGHTEWGKNEGLTEALLARLGDITTRRVEQSGDEGIWRGGMIIDTPADFAKKDKHTMITRCVREFEVNVLLVVGNERLHVEMSKLMSTNKTVQVVRVPKNGGATAIDSAYRRRLQAAQIKSYFFGGPSVSMGTLAPHSMSIRFDILSINRVGDESLVPLSALPIGHTRTIQDTQLVELDPNEGSGELLSKICALPQVERSRKRKRKDTREQTKEAEQVAAPDSVKAEPSLGVVKTEGTSETTGQTSAGIVTTDAKQDDAAVKQEQQPDGTASLRSSQAGPSAKLEEKEDHVPVPQSTATPVKEDEEKDQDIEDDDEEEEEEDEEEEDYGVEDVVVATCPVMGFVHISQVDVDKKKYTVLSPLPGKLPRVELLLGSLEWQDI